MSRIETMYVQKTVKPNVSMLNGVLRSCYQTTDASDSSWKWPTELHCRKLWCRRCNTRQLVAFTELLLERVQHRFTVTRMVPGMKQLPYHTRLAQLGLWTLEERRHRADLLEVFRMYKGLSLTPFCRYFRLSHVNNTKGHSAKFLKNRCSLDLRRFFFSERVIDRWNSLPQHVIDSASINAFKNTIRYDTIR